MSGLQAKKKVYFYYHLSKHLVICIFFYEKLTVLYKKLTYIMLLTLFV